MKTKNFPAKKLARQLTAQGKDLSEHSSQIEAARDRRTKKRRGV